MFSDVIPEVVSNMCCPCYDNKGQPILGNTSGTKLIQCLGDNTHQGLHQGHHRCDKLGLTQVQQIGNNSVATNQG